MRVARIITNGIVLVLGGILLVWALHGLFGIERSVLLFPNFGPGDESAAIILVGVALGIMLMLGAGDVVGTPHRGSLAGLLGGSSDKKRLSSLAVGTVIEVRRTGLEVNDVPQYEIIFSVTQSNGERFISAVRELLDATNVGAVQPGSALPVRFDPNDHDAIAVADIDDPEVEAAMLEWRIERGLIDPRYVAARRHGIVSRASVLALRPTGRRRENQVEIDLRLLVTPNDGRPAWEVATQLFVMPEALPHVQVGSPVFAQYEPHDPHTCALRIDIGKETVR